MPEPAQSDIEGAFGMAVRVVVIEVGAGTFAGVKLIGPRGGIHGVTWIESPHALDDLIDDLERAREAIS